MGALATIGALLASTAGSVWSNVQNAKNQLSINKQNIGMQYAINADQIAVAQMNNQTAIDLANTAHQREVNDLRDANLNPILSAGGNGAGVPSLQAPDLHAAAGSAYQMSNPLAGIGASAKEMGRLFMGQAQAEADYEKEVVRAQRIQNDLDEQVKNNQAYYSELERVALAQLQYSGVDDKGVHRFDNYPQKLVDLAKEGIIADLKLRANANWIKNLGAITGGAGDAAGAATSGANAAKTILKLVK